MFDPSIFDNLKVVIEGSIYDLDFNETIAITQRQDLVDLSSMSRLYAIQFQWKQNKEVIAEVRLSTSLKDLAEEWLGQNQDDAAGCILTIHFYFRVDNEQECEAIHHHLSNIWNGRPGIEQRLSYIFGEQIAQSGLQNEVTIHFNRKINENQIEDFPQIFRYLLQSVTYLCERK